jgi:AraC-like DNA-binding protein
VDGGHRAARRAGEHDTRQVGVELSGVRSSWTASRLSGLELPPEHPVGALLCSTLRTLWRGSPSSTGFAPEAALSAIAGLARWAVAPAVEPKPSLEVLGERAREVMVRSSADPRVSAATVAAQLRVSRRHLDRATLATTGFTGEGLLHELRLQRARALLASQRVASVGLVAVECGFSSPSHFSRSFRRRFGIAPSTLR